jgi:FMN-dependent NADH-azoreductase
LKLVGSNSVESQEVVDAVNIVVPDLHNWKVISFVTPLLSKKNPSNTELYVDAVVETKHPTLLITLVSIWKFEKLPSNN